LYKLYPPFCFAQTQDTLEERIQRIMSRPEFAHSHFGLEFFSVESGKPVYTLNEQQLFVPGSTTKLLTEGTALEVLGGDYRFHTRVYRIGELKKNGTLKGDLVLVASGDPDLSNRIQPGDTLAFENEDHSYGGQDSKGLAGDPLLVTHELAQQIAAKGIKRIDGRLLVDVSLFSEGPRELGTGVVISPIVVNDNLLDVVVTPGEKQGVPVKLQISPQTAYIRIVNQASTGAADSRTKLNYEDEKTNLDGSRSVTLTGNLPVGHAATMVAYAVPKPSEYAAALLREALQEKGISIKSTKGTQTPDFTKLAASYTTENVVAEHVSPPLKEDVKITLKVSQNLHASMTPYLLGALVAHKSKQADQAGFEVENSFLKKGKLDLTAAAQSDGAGGDAYFTPEFIVSYLNYMRQQNDFSDFYRGLPILGRDGTLFKIQVNSAAAGHVHAKTGTNGTYDALNKDLLITGKGLSGYMETASGQHLILALYINMVPVGLQDPEAAQKIAGEALGEIAAAAYDAPLR
jgi:D-alanyl-D-alanine carboxypeptidase/D-alanyl-D-alanine-endopeptidase (penicillin-binding protein 4)